MIACHRQFAQIVVHHSRLSTGGMNKRMRKPSFAKASEGSLVSPREREVVGGEGLEPPTFCV